ncbi:hypothetical protein DLM78_18110 [Leptospira stimsonii]|uniref:Uncharacterized protein n=1 Tax=Leptospira stimsonii TaxID=2202203 RepID=A0A8B3CL41_9LEPT|nr:hypothetical protein DLM78_18110 [Leptospira stimsonii]
MDPELKSILSKDGWLWHTFRYNLEDDFLWVRCKTIFKRRKEMQRESSREIGICRSSYKGRFACEKFDFVVEESLRSFPPPKHNDSPYESLTPPPKNRGGARTFTEELS